jgi:hypothetical protein
LMSFKFNSLANIQHELRWVREKELSGTTAFSMYYSLRTLTSQ